MMFGTMRDTGLYPPVYVTRPVIEREAVVLLLLNESRPSVWEQVSDFIDRHGSIGNTEVRGFLGTDDTLRASKQIKGWVDRGLLIVANPQAGKRLRRYTKPNAESPAPLFSELPGE